MPSVVLAGNDDVVATAAAAAGRRPEARYASTADAAALWPDLDSAAVTVF